VLKAVTGRFRQIHAATLLVAVLFVIKYAFFPD
jgi:AGZA family xanthine/uracil permease-like MFS transporter